MIILLRECEVLPHKESRLYNAPPQLLVYILLQHLYFIGNKEYAKV